MNNRKWVHRLFIKYPWRRQCYLQHPKAFAIYIKDTYINVPKIEKTTTYTNKKRALKLPGSSVTFEDNVVKKLNSKLGSIQKLIKTFLNR